MIEEEFLGDRFVFSDIPVIVVQYPLAISYMEYVPSLDACSECYEEGESFPMI